MSEDLTLLNSGALPLPARGTDYVVVSRDGGNLLYVEMRNWPLSNPVRQYADTKVAPSQLATINGQSLIQPGGNIVISSGGSSVPTWGAITGTLSAQTDLQNALNSKAATDVTQTWVAQGQIIGTTANGGLTISSNTITLNLGAFNSFDLGTLAAGAYTLANPTGLAAGVSYKGDIKYTTPSSGAVTFAYGSAWDFDGATPSAPTTTNATVFFDYASHSATNVRLSAPKVWS